MPTVFETGGLEIFLFRNIVQSLFASFARIYEIKLFPAEVESRTQGSRPRPRTQIKIRGQGQGQPFRGQTLSRQGQECSRPRPRTKDTDASVLQKEKIKSSKKFFTLSPQKWCRKNFFSRSTKFEPFKK